MKDETTLIYVYIHTTIRPSKRTDSMELRFHVVLDKSLAGNEDDHDTNNNNDNNDDGGSSSSRNINNIKHLVKITLLPFILLFSYKNTF